MRFMPQRILQQPCRQAKAKAVILNVIVRIVKVLKGIAIVETEVKSFENCSQYPDAYTPDVVFLRVRARAVVDAGKVKKGCNLNGRIVPCI